MSILKKSLISAGVAASLFSVGSVHAAYFTVNSGYGTTAAFNVIESNVNATSTYTSLIGPVANFDALIGTTTLVTDTSADGNVTGFLNNTAQLLDSVDAGFGSNFSLLFSYTLSGTASVIDGLGVYADGTLDKNGDGKIDSAPILGPAPLYPIIGGLDAILPNYTSGKIEITYVDLTGTVLGTVGATQKVLELDMTSVAVDGADVILNADVDYSWYAGGSNLVEDMFQFVGASESWYDYWLTGTPTDPIRIVTRSDFNIDPNLVPVSDCGPTANGCNTFSRTTNLNVTTTVPEPGSLALMGIGLLGLGFSAMRKSRKA